MMNNQLSNSKKSDASKLSPVYPFSNPSERPDSALLAPEQHVLPTLQSDGSRRWVNPSLAQGFFWNRRRIVAYSLIAFFVTLPHLRLGGKPLVLIDILHRSLPFWGILFIQPIAHYWPYLVYQVFSRLCSCDSDSWTSLVRLGMSTNRVHRISISTDRSNLLGCVWTRWSLSKNASCISQSHASGCVRRLLHVPSPYVFKLLCRYRSACQMDHGIAF